MAIILKMNPLIPPMSWEEFRGTTAPFAIALDGVVDESPKFDSTGPRANFNHHEGVSRLETRATCAQVLMAIRQGIFNCFRDTNGVRVDVYVNDCDEDVCVSWFLLKHGCLAEQPMNPLLNRLVFLEDMLDATSGAYPFPKDLGALRQLAWIFEPYRRFRLSGELEKKENDSFIGIVEDVENRIMRHITGQGSEITIDTRYERIGGGQGWTMIREIGAQGRTGAFSDNIQAYVSVRKRPNGNSTYTVGRMSPFVRFNLPLIFAKMNEIESTDGDRWGGGDTIGGSPRVGGSKLKPKEVEKIINELLQI